MFNIASFFIEFIGQVVGKLESFIVYEYGGVQVSFLTMFIITSIVSLLFSAFVAKANMR